MIAFHVDIVPLRIYLARYTLYVALYRVEAERRDVDPRDFTCRHLKLYLLCRFSKN